MSKCECECECESVGVGVGVGGWKPNHNAKPADANEKMDAPMKSE